MKGKKDVQVALAILVLLFIFLLVFSISSPCCGGAVCASSKPIEAGINSYSIEPGSPIWIKIANYSKSRISGIQVSAPQGDNLFTGATTNPANVTALEPGQKLEIAILCPGCTGGARVNNSRFEISYTDANGSRQTATVTCQGVLFGEGSDLLIYPPFQPILFITGLAALALVGYLAYLKYGKKPG